MKLWVFDFDDTLVKTDTVTHVTTATGEKFDLSPSEFVAYDKQPGDVFDFTDFEKLNNPRPIRWVNRILHNVYKHHGRDAIVVLSARSVVGPIQQYLDSIGLGDIEAVALGNILPEAKATWISERIARDNLSVVEFLDDSHKNVRVVEDLRNHHPNVTIVARHIVHSTSSFIVRHQ